RARADRGRHDRRPGDQLVSSRAKTVATIVDHFWRGLGLVSTGLGLVGAILPLVPTTPFLLVAAYAFARSSPRLHDWLLHHPQLGPLIINWRQHRAISRRVKIASLVLMGSM